MGERNHKAYVSKQRLQESHRLASIIAQVILKHNLNAAAVARDMGVDPNSLYSFLNGVPWGTKRLNKLQCWLDRFQSGTTDEIHLAAFKNTPRKLGEA